MQNQVTELSDKMPQMIDNAKAEISQNPVGKKILEKVSSPGSIKKTQNLTGTFFKSTFGIFGDIYVVLFLGIFFTVAPGKYKQGIITLIPKKGQAKGEQILDKLGENLKKWLKGKNILHDSCNDINCNRFSNCRCSNVACIIDYCRHT